MKSVSLCEVARVFYKSLPFDLVKSLFSPFRLRNEGGSKKEETSCALKIIAKECQFCTYIEP